MVLNIGFWKVDVVKKSIVIGIGLVILIVGLIFLFVRSGDEYLEVHVFRVLLDMGSGSEKIITSNEELISFFEENYLALEQQLQEENMEVIQSIIDEYDESFFEYKALAMVYHIFSPARINESLSAVFDEGKVKIKYERYQHPEGAGTIWWMKMYLIIVEVPKDIEQVEFSMI